MTGWPEIIGGFLIALGAFFYLVGALGIYRMPDVFTRMHAAGISDTVGAGLLLIGMMFFGGWTLVTAKLAIILGVIFFTSPIATHALAQAALHAGVEPILDNKRVLRGPGVPAPKPKPKTKSTARSKTKISTARKTSPAKRKSAARTKGRTRS